MGFVRERFGSNQGLPNQSPLSSIIDLSLLSLLSEQIRLHRWNCSSWLPAILIAGKGLAFA
jgi:hypothetical protein